MRSYAKWMADSVIKRHTDLTSYWAYEFGLTLDGIAAVWKATGDKAYFDYIKQCMDTFVQDDGSIRGYDISEYNLDHLNNGKILLTIWHETHEEKYRKALQLLRSQLDDHPRTKEGVFWHKKMYPEQIWLDGLYMGATFYAKYLAEFGGTKEEFDDIGRQFVLSRKHNRDPKTGLLYHAYDDARKQPWADPVTGLSHHFWSRSMGWYAMALVDTLEVMPESSEYHQKLKNILNETIEALLKVEDPTSHVWYQVPDCGSRKGNYLEASGSSMIAYTLFKCVRLGYLPEEMTKNAEESYKGLIDEFISETPMGTINLNKICFVAGLGGKPTKAYGERDGSFAYYISEPIVCNEPKGIGPFILAAAEYERLAGIDDK